MKRTLSIYLFVMVILSSGETFAQIPLGKITLKDTPIEFSLDSKGFILSGVVENNIDPFYHASALVHNNLKAVIDNNAEINLRIVDEVWSFSNPYQNGEKYKNYFWARPSVKVNVKKSSLGFLNNVMDSLTFLAGDLWRQTDADGLLLEDFEAQGIVVNFNFPGKLKFTNKIMGAGWTNRYDDYRSYILTYDKLASLTYAYDYLTIGEGIYDAKVLNFGLYKKIKNVTLKADIAKNFTTKKFAALAGAEYSFTNKKFDLNISAQFRHYDGEFFFDGGLLPIPYFNSLTAIDKDVNNFQLYQIFQTFYAENQNTLALKINAEYNLTNAIFFHLYTESLLGSNLIQQDIEQEKIAYELSGGFNFNKLIKGRTGISNKFFRLSEDYNSMFTLRKKPWVFVKIEFQL